MVDPVLVCTNLTVGYNGKTVVPGIQLNLTAGESLALVGTNGSGKSTLIKTIVGLIPALGGVISVFGSAPGTFPARVSYLSQRNQSKFILPLRVYDAVEMGRFAVNGLLRKLTKADEALIWDCMKRMNVDHLSEKPLRGLSGGQMQRVYLAQVLAKNGDLILLDEPATGLDLKGMELYKTAIEEEKKRGAAVIIATHDIAEAMEANQTMLLAGKVVAQGTGEAVLTAKHLLETFGIVLKKQEDCYDIQVLEREHGHDHGDMH